MKVRALIAGALLILGCVGGLSVPDATAVRQGAALNLAAMDRADGGERALNRAAYCASWGIANRNHIPIVDAGFSCVSP